MRSYPRLLHPVSVVLEQLDTASTVYDTDAREPVQQAARLAEVTLPAQMKYGDSASLEVNSSGIQAGENGYALFRTRDLTAKGITLKIGDRIKSAGSIGHDAYLTRIQPVGHYPRWNNTLVKAFFTDRQPAKNR